MVPPFYIKLVGSVVTGDWTGLECPRRLVLMTGCWDGLSAGASVLLLWPLCMARLAFSRAVCILRGGVLWMRVSRRRKWKLSAFLCVDLKILRTWLLLPSVDQSNHSANPHSRRGRMPQWWSGHMHTGGKGLVVAIFGNICPTVWMFLHVSVDHVGEHMCTLLINRSVALCVHPSAWYLSHGEKQALPLSSH